MKGSNEKALKFLEEEEEGERGAGGDAAPPQRCTTGLLAGSRWEARRRMKDTEALRAVHRTTWTCN